MKIYIDGELPKSCTFCEFLVHCDACEGYENYCPFIGHVGYDPDDPTTSVGIVSVTPKRERHVECPLEKIPHGEWIEKSMMDLITFFECSECGSLTTHKFNFCPDCGTQMGGERNG